MTKATVVMPIYNHEAYVKEAVVSVVRQTHSETELICVDDGSSDDSINVTEKALALGKRPGYVVTQSNAGAHHRAQSRCFIGLR